MNWPVDGEGLVRVKSLDRDSLEQWVGELGMPAYRGRQVFAWLYGKGAISFDEMTDLPVSARSKLARRATLEVLKPLTRLRSTDGTIKSLLELSSGQRIESVLIPDFGDDGTPKRMTVCVSSQSGCAMGCTFCATGQMGFRQDLSVGEIADQVVKWTALQEKSMTPKSGTSSSWAWANHS